MYQDKNNSVSTDSSFSTPLTSAEKYHTSDLISIAIQATETLHLPEQYIQLELVLVNLLLDCIRCLQVATITHIPCSVRPLFYQVLCSLFRAATQKGAWGLVQLLIFPKVVLRVPSHHSPPKREVPKTLLKNHLKLWQSEGGILKLWKELESLSASPTLYSSNSPTATNRALHWARMGHHGKAIQALSSSGVANPDDDSVQAEILKRHPQGPVLRNCDLP